MQSYAEGIRNAVWSKLEEIFIRYAGGKTYIRNEEIEKVITEVLNETSQAEIDYVMKNLFRLDSDNNGSIDLPELGNFLLKRHCGEIALQRMHMRDGMSMGARRRMNLKEFTILMNHAYSFLGVKVEDEGAKLIFDDADKDHDGIISYEEYFSFVEKHILKPQKVVVVQEPTQAKEVNSRLRRFIWQQVLRLYNLYDKDGNKQLDFDELEAILKDIMKGSSKEDLEFVMVSVYHLNPTSTLAVEVFTPFFIVHAGELGLSKFAKQHPNQRTLTLDEFILLFRASYYMLNVDRVSSRLLGHFFHKIDTNKDGQISFGEYLDWVKNFLAVRSYSGLQYYIEEDDADLPIGADFILTDEQLALIKKQRYFNPFKFSSLDLARRARKRTLELIEQFDVNQNRNLEDNQIIEILKKLMKSDKFDIFYVLANAFRYDQNSDGLISYDEMADFFLELHNGELALMRLHRVHSFVRGDQRLMCLKEFILTLTDSLAYIDVVPTTEELTVLFSEIDLDNDGWVSYKTYFEFLTLYFGSKSEVSLESRRDNEFQSVVRKHSSLNLSPEQRFARIIMREMKYLLDDYNPFQTYDEQLIRRFLKDLFKLTDDEIDYVMRNLFRYGVGSGGLFMEMEIAGIFLEILFAEIALRRMHKDKKFLRWKDRLISLPEFLQLVDSACYWMRNKPPQDLLIEIFGNLDTDKDGFITYEQYIMFIRNFLSKRRDNSIDWKRFIEQEPPKTKDEKLYEDIWSDLRVLYMHYVKGQYLQEDELELLVKEVLHETTQNELEYIFWNMFRYDPNNDKNIQFEEFAPFILIHAGEIALQRFHFQQVLGKNSLSNQEFKLVFRQAYHFLRTLNKTDQLLNVIFGELDTNNDGFITYKEFMTWIVLNVSRTVR